MTALRFVSPRNECDAGSIPPIYASTSTSLTATRPSAESDQKMHPSRSGATSVAGRSKKERGSSSRWSGRTVCSVRQRVETGSARGPGRLLVHGQPQPGQLLSYADGRGAAAAGPGRQRAVGAQYLAHVGREQRGDPLEVGVADLRQLALVHLAPHDQVPHDLVRLAEGGAPAHQ